MISSLFMSERSGRTSPREQISSPSLHLPLLSCQQGSAVLPYGLDSIQRIEYRSTDKRIPGGQSVVLRFGEGETG